MTAAPISPPPGLARRTVRLVEHDPRWRLLAAVACARLARFLGDRLPIEHIGSTAVPAVAGKAILDLMVGVASDEARRTPIAPLRGPGDAHGDSDAIAGRLSFRRDDTEGPRTHRLSACVVGGRFWVTHLACHDALRQDRALAPAYLRLKVVPAARHPTERIAHSEAKSESVARVLRARGVE